MHVHDCIMLGRLGIFVIKYKLTGKIKHVTIQWETLANFFENRRI